jgi:hypothetical protein
MAAVLSCGPGAALSHESAAAHWGIRRDRPGPIEVSVANPRKPRRTGIKVHRREALERHVTRHHGIPVTNVVCTIVDIAPRLSRRELEAVINEADNHDLIDPEALRTALGQFGHRTGVVPVRDLLDRYTFVLTDSDVERLFLPIAREAGLPPPLTKQWVNGFKVDFYWPELGLVVETDSLRYHRTPVTQARDVKRDQAHTVAELTRLRFTHAELKYERDHVLKTLRAVARRLKPR